MDAVTVLAVLISLILGVLLTVIIDNQYWGKRLKTAVTQKKETDEKFKTTNARLISTETRFKDTTRNYSAATSQITQLNTEIEKLQQQIKTAESDVEAAQNNLNRVCTELDDLRADNDYLRQKLETADIHEEAQQAQIAGLLKQLTETQNLRKKLLTAEEKSRTAQEQLATLQERLTLVQRHLKANDKNELVIIKGIGPKYAQRLREAGIATLSDLANQTPERVAEALKLKNWQTADMTAWIEEAQQLIGDQPEQSKS